MRVILNGLAALKPRTGVGHYVGHLHAALQHEFPDDTVTLYPGRLLAATLRRAQSTRTRRAARPTAPAALNPDSEALDRTDRLKSVAKSLIAGHFRVAARGADLYHEPNFVPFESRKPTVVTVHDLSVVKHPEWHPASRVALHAKRFRQTLNQVSHVLVVSETVRAELLAYADLTPDRVTTVHNGTDPEMRPLSAEVVAGVRRKLDLPARFFLTLGTIEPRKNLLMAMQAFVSLPAEVRIECPLVLVGPWGWRAEAEREYYVSQAEPAGARHLGYVSANDLPGVVQAANVLIYPSFYEGFGLPPLEALAMGRPVLAAEECLAVREVCGRFAEYLPARDVLAWSAAMSRLAEDALASDAPERIAHAAQFTWRDAARKTMQVYRQVLGKC